MYSAATACSNKVLEGWLVVSCDMTLYGASRSGFVNAELYTRWSHKPLCISSNAVPSLRTDCNQGAAGPSSTTAERVSPRELSFRSQVQDVINSRARSFRGYQSCPERRDCVEQDLIWTGSPLRSVLRESALCEAPVLFHEYDGVVGENIPCSTLSHTYRYPSG